VHIIAQNVGSFSDHELVFWACWVVKCIVRLQQGAAWHASVELAIGVAWWRREDAVQFELIVSD